MEHTDNLNIVQFKQLITPQQLKDKYPEDEQVAHLVAQSRRIIHSILTNEDKRRIVITGPCSLHDKKATYDYANRLKKLQDKVADKLLLVMRAYFEKPRTTLGWKGMLYDPYLDGSDNIEEGFNRAREILLELGKIGLPCATEFLDPIVPQYIADLISWAAIGARTAESQIHRQMASGLSMPIGFKNATDGNLTSAVDAVKAAGSPHSFLGISRNGQVIIAETRGNKFGHIVMRGGSSEPNYSAEYVAFAGILLKKAGIPNGIIIDCSHANSNKDYRLQRNAFSDVARQVKNDTKLISGIMLESFITEGNQTPAKPETLTYGQSLTDGCIGWEETEELIGIFANAVKL
ncbi:MAG: 3-deoxy-7-phosphoheptulonate synthase [Planctomycetes bacterium]|nr:3-deoxy-7-phosphoheptulonate synthase [Planctomycetota bacterium]MBU1518932.1 3-deoxy-7-phosphoheptulonate synthase [Planctomycetota bacterium]MBU2457955.1 3-deoxy-7-phosphoheptulonate synthase [Planctomycetota bacterium]